MDLPIESIRYFGTTLGYLDLAYAFNKTLKINTYIWRQQ